jgi:1,4-alpha-glucan branching enzyme
VLDLVGELNALYRSEPALHRGDVTPDGFRWLIADDAARSVFAWQRDDPADRSRPVVVVVNATPQVHHNQRIGVPVQGRWVEALSTDDERFGGSGVTNGELEAVPVAAHGHWWSVVVTLPPLGVALLRPA